LTLGKPGQFLKSLIRELWEDTKPRSISIKKGLFDTNLCALVDIIHINFIKSYTLDLLTNCPRIIIIFIAKGGECPTSHLIATNPEEVNEYDIAALGSLQRTTAHARDHEPPVARFWRRHYRWTGDGDLGCPPGCDAARG
jgi:hypothetical protein